MGCAARRSASPTNCSWTSTRRRSARAAATASRWMNGCATPRPKASASSCTPAAARQAAVLRRDPPRGGRLPRQRGQGTADDPANPAWHIGGGHIPNDGGSPIPFTMLLNLASVVNADTPDMLWGFIRRYLPGRRAEEHAALPGPPGGPRRRLLPGLRPHPGSASARRPRTPNAPPWTDLADTLAAMPGGSTPEAIQDEVYEVGKRHPFPALKDWFECLYQVLLGQQEGPRFRRLRGVVWHRRDGGADPVRPGPPGRKRLEALRSATSPPCWAWLLLCRCDLRRAAGVPPPQAGRHQAFR